MIPPMQITISGNKCGGCCKQSIVRGDEVPPYYLVVCSERGNLFAVKAVKKEYEERMAARVFEIVQKNIKEQYQMDWNDIPFPAKPINLKRVPSVAQIKNIEAIAMGFKEGVKKGVESATSIPSAIVKRSFPDSDESRPASIDENWSSK